MKRDISFERIVSVDSSIAFEAVRNFDEYVDFIPTCTKASLISSEPPIEVGQLEFNILGKNYFIQSENTVSNDSVNIKQLEGPFNSFEGKWSVKKLNNDTCKIIFYAEFELPFLLNTVVPKSLIEKFSDSIIESFIKKVT
ncbi:MAG: hypothetical protein ISQ64_01270 [SAR86 cluster bacterium]|uniref:Coenzyme Q-binding protein COQ10 START domain-containing protein n=1 Tax=SAR86 cluster bacterium TaxID=2030880 RepID=A0A937I8T1_9GAMM|nr:hypothetical protein [SAR86 cluster bacterium]